MLFVPWFAGTVLFPLVPSSVDSVVQPVLILLSILGKYVAALGSTLFTAVPHQRVPGDRAVVITALFYLFAVVAARIGRVLGRYASEPTHATRLRYLGAGALVLAGVLVLGFTVKFRPRVIPPETVRLPGGRIGCSCSQSVVDCVRPGSASSAWTWPFVGFVPGRCSRRIRVRHEENHHHTRTERGPPRTWWPTREHADEPVDE